MRAISYQSPAYLLRSTSGTVFNFLKLEEGEEHAVIPSISIMSDNFVIAKYLSILIWFSHKAKKNHITRINLLQRR